MRLKFWGFTQKYGKFNRCQISQNFWLQPMPEVYCRLKKKARKQNKQNKSQSVNWSIMTSNTCHKLQVSSNISSITKTQTIISKLQLPLHQFNYCLFFLLWKMVLSNDNKSLIIVNNSKCEDKKYHAKTKATNFSWNFYFFKRTM